MKRLSQVLIPPVIFLSGCVRAATDNGVELAAWTSYISTETTKVPIAYIANGSSVPVLLSIVGHSTFEISHLGDDGIVRRQILKGRASNVSPSVLRTLYELPPVVKPGLGFEYTRVNAIQFVADPGQDIPNYSAADLSFSVSLCGVDGVPFVVQAQPARPQ